MGPSNKIVKLDEFSMKDDLSHVQVVEAPIPEPKQGEVLVNAYLRPVNPTDVILIKTGWGGMVPLPSTPGSEGVGKVVKNGPGASKFKEGQRVAAAPWPQFQGKGSWAQYVVIPEKDLVSMAAQSYSLQATYSAATYHLSIGLTWRPSADSRARELE